jgi:hypothetical protein
MSQARTEAVVVSVRKNPISHVTSPLSALALPPSPSSTQFNYRSFLLFCHPSPVRRAYRSHNCNDSQIHSPRHPISGPNHDVQHIDPDNSNETHSSTLAMRSSSPAV